MSIDTPNENPEGTAGNDADEMALFDSLMESYAEAGSGLQTGQVTKAHVVEVKKDYTLLDIGDKAEGIVPTSEFEDFAGNINIKPGDEVEVVIKGRDNETGQVRVSHRAARQASFLDSLKDAMDKKISVRGKVTKALPTGVIVNTGFDCFMPGSHADTSRVEKLESLVGQEIEVYVIEVSKKGKNTRVVVSRREFLKEDQKKKKGELLESLNVADEVSGKVKNVVDFGVFVDIGGMDGLVPRDEVAWERIEKKEDIEALLKVGISYKFKIVSIDKEKGRIALSRKQMKPDPWLKVEKDYPKDLTVGARVTSFSRNCAYVELEDKTQGRIHRDNLSWSQNVKKPQDVVNVGDEIKAVVLGYDNEKRVLELGLKQVDGNPWEEIPKRFPEGARIKVKIADVAEFGAFADIEENLRGLIHVSDMTYDKGHNDPKKFVTVGQEIEVVVLKVDPEKQRINLGMKQLDEDPFAAYIAAHPAKSVVTGIAKSLTEFGVFVELAPKVEGLLHKSEWARERTENLAHEVKVGDEITAQIIEIKKSDRKISLSRKAHLRDEERKAIDEYKKPTGKSTTLLGDLLKDIKLKG